MPSIHRVVLSGNESSESFLVEQAHPVPLEELLAPPTSEAAS